MRDLIRSLERNIAFFHRKYPEGHPVLSGLEKKLAYVRARAEKASQADSEWRAKDHVCCDRLTECPFFIAVSNVDDVSEELKGYVKDYCCSPDKVKCFRLKHIMRYGEPPADNISPVGSEFSISQ